MRANKRNLKPNFSVLPLIGIIFLSIFFYLSSAYEPVWCFNWNGIRKNIKDSVKFIEHRGIPGRAVGCSALPSMHWNTRYWLKENLTIQEANILLKHPRGEIKAIAYEVLLRRVENIDKLLLEIANDTVTFVCHPYGDLQMLSEYIFEEKFYLYKEDVPPRFNIECDLTAKIDCLEIINEKYKANKKNKERYLRNFYKRRFY